MANIQNLIPIRTSEEAKIKGRNGGLKSGPTKTPGKKLAARLRELKKKGLTSEDAKVLFNMMTDGDVLNLDVLIGLKSLLPTLKYDKDKIQGWKTMIDLSKAIHGEKRKVESVSLNISLDVEDFRLKGEELLKLVRQEEEVEDEKDE